MIRLRFVLLYLGAILLISCSATTGGPSTGISQSTPARDSACQGDCLTKATQSPNSTSLPVSSLPPSCKSDQFAISSQMIITGEHSSVYQRRGSDAWRLLPGGLSIYLEVVSTTIPYANPIFLQLTIQNDTDESVSLALPQQLALRNDAVLPPNSLIVNLFTSSGDRVQSDYVDLSLTPYYAPPVNAFATLPPNLSWTVNFILDQQGAETHLATPLSPGSYHMTSFLYLADSGPRLEERSSEIVNIGAWIGRTDESNSVTFTILPPEQ